MGVKAEISWKGRTADGFRREVYARRVGGEWKFYARAKRFEQWKPLEHPPLEDWQELLEAVRRRIARRLQRPEEESRLKKVIRELFPEAPPE